MQYDRLEYASSPISPYATCAPYSSSGEELPARHESGSEYSVQNSATSPARAANAAIPDGNRTSSDSAAVASMSRNTSPSTLSATARSRACATQRAARFNDDTENDSRSDPSTSPNQPGSRSTTAYPPPSSTPTTPRMNASRRSGTTGSSNHPPRMASDPFSR